MELLLRYGAQVNPPRTGQDNPGPPLCGAARSGNVAVVRLLIKYGADIEAPDRWGTPLIHAALKGHDKIVSLLLEAGADRQVLGRRMGVESDIWDQTPLDLVRPFEETLDHFERVLAEL